MHKVAPVTELSITKPPATKPPVIDHACQVMGVTPLTKDTFEVELQSFVSLNYHAGQYLKLELDVNADGQFHSLSYSIANSFNPEQPHRLQLFIQNSSELTDKIIKRLTKLNKDKGQVKATLPMGRAFLQSDLGLNHLFIAAGSGISKIKCLAEEILKQQADVNVTIYWSNKHVDDFYLLEEFQHWVEKNKNLTFKTILECADTNWVGLSGYIYEVIKADYDDLNNVQAYLCGSPKMVYGTIDQLKAYGLKEENCYSDVFEYAPRIK